MLPFTRCYVSLIVKPIGYVRSPYKKKEDTPFQGRFSSNLSTIIIFDEYAEALTDIELFNHLIVLYWANQASLKTLKVKTPHDDKLHGLFATRTLHRPNPIGFCVVELIERKGLQLIVRGLDAYDGSPVLDLKPYIPIFDCHLDANMGWLSNKKLRLTRRG